MFSWLVTDSPVRLAGRPAAAQQCVGSERESVPRSVWDNRMTRVRSGHVSGESSGDIIGLPCCGDTPPGVTTTAMPFLWAGTTNDKCARNSV